jgi:hypothetical protein
MNYGCLIAVSNFRTRWLSYGQRGNLQDPAATLDLYEIAGELYSNMLAG